MAITILYSAVETVASRFPQYIVEMEHFFADHGVPTRSVDALPRVVTGLRSDQTLREDLQSMLQVIRMAEPEVSTLEALAILLLAATGAQNASELQQGDAAEETARQLFRFVKDAMRSAASEDAAFQEGSAAAGVPDVGVEQEHAEWATVGTQGAGPVRALAMAAEEESFDVPEIPASSEIPSGPQMDRAEQAWANRVRIAPSAPVKAVRTDWGSRWIFAACGVLLGLLLGFFVERQKPAPAMGSAPALTSETAENVEFPTAARREGHAGRGLHGRRIQPAKHALDAYQPGEPEVSGTPGTSPAVAVAPHPGVETAKALPNRTSAAVRPALVKGLPLGPATDQPATMPRSAGVRPGRVVTGTAGVMAANVLSSPAPAYPAQASAAQVQGEVVVEAIVGREGDVIDTRVVSGPLLLREAALQAVQRWRYRPYEVDGKPAEIATMARLEFRLGEP